MFNLHMTLILCCMQRKLTWKVYICIGDEDKNIPIRWSQWQMQKMIWKYWILVIYIAKNYVIGRRTKGEDQNAQNLSCSLNEFSWCYDFISIKQPTSIYYSEYTFLQMKEWLNINDLLQEILEVWQLPFHLTGGGPKSLSSKLVDSGQIP
jgi:hypothetical protein